MHAAYRRIKCWFPEAGYARIGKGWIDACDAENKRNGNSFFFGGHTMCDILLDSAYYPYRWQSIYCKFSAPIGLKPLITRSRLEFVQRIWGYPKKKKKKKSGIIPEGGRILWFKKFMKSLI